MSKKAKNYTVREFKFKKRAEFLVNFARDIHSLSGNFAKILQKKETKKDFESDLSSFKESYYQIAHFYDKFNNVYIKDTEVNRCMHSIIGSAKIMNELSDSVVFKNDIKEIKYDFSNQLKEIVQAFDNLSSRLNEFGVIMWI